MTSLFEMPKDNPAVEMVNAMADLQADPIASGRYLLTADKRGPAFPKDGTATDPRGLRNAMLRSLTEDLAELLYRIDAAWVRSISREPFRNITPAGQSLFRAKAEQIVALVDPWCLGRASTRAIEWAALSNNLDGGDWNEATQDLGRQMAHDAISVLLLELSRMYREDVGRS